MRIEAFRLLSLLLVVASTAGFRCQKNYQLQLSRPPSVLFASVKEEKHQLTSYNDYSSHQSKTHQRQHSPVIQIQGIENLQQRDTQNQTHHQVNHNQPETVQQAYLDQEQSYVLSIQDMNPILQWTNSKGKTKVLNLYGIFNLLTIAFTLPFWLLAMEVLQKLGDSIEGFDENRAKFDYSGKIWCRTYLRLVDSYPEIAGDVSRLKNRDAGGYGGACLFVANHASFLDIPVLCTVLDPVFKFIAKDSLVKLPGVGKQLVGVSIIESLTPSLDHSGIFYLLTNHLN